MWKKTKEEPAGENVLESVKAGKEGKKRTLRVTVFPKEGGRPFTVDVEPSEQGDFSIAKDHPGKYKVQRGSVWEENGTLRAIVNEGNPLTVNAYTLVGDESFDPVALNGVASNNLWEQLAAIARRKSAWKQASTWLFGTLGIVFILVMVWQVTTTGNGLEELRDAIQGMPVGGAETGGAGGSAPAGGGGGHNNIAPGGG